MGSFGVPTPQPAVVHSIGYPIIDERIESLCKSARESADRAESIESELSGAILENKLILSALIVEHFTALSMQALRNQAELVAITEDLKGRITTSMTWISEEEATTRNKIQAARSEVWNDFWRGCWRFLTKPL